MAQAAVVDKCDLCESDGNVNFFCADCDEILCSSCKISHAKSKATKIHKIIPLPQARDENIVHKSTPVFCSEHSAVEVNLFCLQCDCLICTQCLAGKHKGHNVTVPDVIKDSKAEELNKLIKTLHEKKSTFEDAFDVHAQAHSRFLKSADQTEKEISDQKAKIIEELNNVCKEQFSQITKLRQDEEKKYTDACEEIKAQNKVLTSAIQMAENSIASNNAAIIIQVTADTADTLQRLEAPTIPQTTITTYQPGDGSLPTVCAVQGEVIIKHTTAIHQPEDRSYPSTSRVLKEQQGAKPKLMKDVHTAKPLEQKTGGDNTQHQNRGFNKPRIDVDKVSVKSVLTVESKDVIQVIVPLQNQTAWVKAYGETCLSLIDNSGKIITKSVTLGDRIYDAKEFINEILVTCWDHCKVTKMSADGKTASTFSDLSPYFTRGFSVTQDMDVMVCLHSAEDKNDNKVVRLTSTGDIIQTIQYDQTGAPLFNNPFGVTSLTTDEVIVVDHSQPRRVIGIDNQSQRLFIWEGEVQGRKLDKYSVSKITRDNYNNVFVTDFYNHRVYLLGKDGSEATCLIDSRHGIYDPVAVVADNERQLWVGCCDRKINIIQY